MILQAYYGNILQIIGIITVFNGIYTHSYVIWQYYRFLDNIGNIHRMRDYCILSGNMSVASSYPRILWSQRELLTLWLYWIM